MILERLSPQDFYRQLDWIREEWRCDEWEMAKKLVRLRRTFEHLPPAYFKRAQPMLAQLARARIVNGQPWSATLSDLRGLVSEWDRGRPALLTCQVCGVAVRGRPALDQHYELVHDLDRERGAAA